MGCDFCDGRWQHMEYHRSTSWRVQLHTDQYYLGRSLVIIDRHVVDLNEMKPAERSDLFGCVLPNLRQCMNRLFDPDLYNYASLGNSERHLHFHVIPRYKSAREFADTTFEDEAWNSHYKNGEGAEVSDEVLDDIKNALADDIT